MKYSHFGLLLFSVGAIAIAAAVLVTSDRVPSFEEIAAQGLLLLVLAGAVRRGRKGGYLAAAAAVFFYVAMRLPLLARVGLSPDMLALMLTRTLTFALVGVAGGELCHRIRYVLARLEDEANIDAASRLLSQHSITRVLRSEVGQYERYGRPFSVVTISLADSLLANESSDGKRAALRAVGTAIRNDVRLVDDVARMDDGRFLLVLPSTDKAGAHVAARRVAARVRVLMRAEESTVRADVFGAEEDLDAIRKLCGAESHGPEARKAA